LGDVFLSSSSPADVYQHKSKGGGAPAPFEAGGVMITACPVEARSKSSRRTKTIFP
jgi:hypothetical protein